MSSTHLYVTSDVLAFSVRYALERKTPAASIVADAVVKVWDQLQAWEQKQLIKEILADTGPTGNTTAWRELWAKVTTLEVKPEPTFCA